MLPYPLHDSCVFFFFNDTATTEIYTLSLHDALPISSPRPRVRARGAAPRRVGGARVRALQAPAPPGHGGLRRRRQLRADRKSTRLNSSHANISYAVFCLKKKNHSACTDRRDGPSTNI